MPEEKGSDAAPHGQSGTHAELVRSNGLLESLATSFQFTNPFVGVFTLYDVALSNGGPSAIWGTLVVCFGQSLVALVLMHLASAFPVAGSVYQWARFLVGPRYGCFVGFMYAVTLIAVLLPFGITAVEYGAAVFEIYQLAPLPKCLCSMLLVALWTAISLCGVRAVTVAGQLGMALQLIATGAFSITLLSSPDKGSQPLSVFLEPPPSLEGWLAGLCAPAWAFWGFEAAAALSEETQGADAVVPLAISFSLFSCLLISLLLNVSLTLAIPDLDAAVSSSGESAVQQIFAAHCPGAVRNLFNVLACLLYGLGGLVGHSVVTRVVWSLARENEVFPEGVSEYLRVVSPATHVPQRAGCVVSGVLAVLLAGNLVPGLDLVTLSANFCTCGIYTVYQACAAGLLYATCTAESMHSGGFSLGCCTTGVCVCSLVFGVGMMANLLWPREITGMWALPVSYAVVCLAGCGLARWIKVSASTVVAGTYSAVPATASDVVGGVEVSKCVEHEDGIEMHSMGAAEESVVEHSELSEYE